MMEKERNVSMARKSLGRPKNLPAWAIVQYSIGESRLDRSKKTLDRFMIRSTKAQAMTSQPMAMRIDDCPAPARMSWMPKSSLKMQKGTPIVRAWKVGDWKMLDSIFFDAFLASWLSIFPLCG